MRLIKRKVYFLLMSILITFLKTLTLVRWYVHKGFLNFGLSANRKKSVQITVSLASYEARYSFLKYTLMNLLTQSLKPNEIIVVLDPNKKHSLPKTLSRFEKYGVRFIDAKEDYRSYKKYVPLALEPTRLFAIYDDDNFIRKSSLRALYKQWLKTPECLVGHRGVELKRRGDSFTKYEEWKHSIEGGEPSLELLITTGAGTLFGINSLNSSVWKPEIFMKISPTADDLWILFVASAYNIKRVLTGSLSSFQISWKIENINSLWHENVSLGGNDRQLELLNEYFSWPARFPE